MIALWKKWTAKLDELSLRERALVFFVAAGLLIVVLYAMALQPLLREQRTLLERIQLNQGQLKAINDELLKSAQSASQDPHAARNERIRKLEARIAAAEKQVAQRREAEQLTPSQLTRLLQDVLGANRNLRVTSMKVLPGTALAQGPASKPAAGAFYRHGVEIELTGTYLELLRYLEAVEALPWGLAWSNVELTTTTYPQIQLRASLYAVSPSPTLLTY